MDKSLAHTLWMWKNNIIFTPKYTIKTIYNKYSSSIKHILKDLCKYERVGLMEGHFMPEHIHILVSIPPKISVSSFRRYLKGKSALIIFEKHTNLKCKF